VRGTIISLEPGHQVVIEVFGEDAHRTIVWSDVFRVEPRKFASDESARLPSEVDEALREAIEVSEEEPLPKGVIRLHIETDDPVIDARGGRTFRFGGRGVTSSDEFTLGNRRGRLTAKVSAGRSGLKTLGKALAWVGVGTAGLGAAFVTDGVISKDNMGQTDETTARAFSVGGVMTGAGVILTAIGFPLAAQNYTEFELHEASTDSPRMVAGNPLSWANTARLWFLGYGFKAWDTHWSVGISIVATTFFVSRLGLQSGSSPVDVTSLVRTASTVSWAPGRKYTTSMCSHFPLEIE